MNAGKALLFLVFLWVGSLSAQNFKPVVYEEYNLKNGLHVILHVDRTAPTAMTYLLYKVGSKDENPQLTGFAHFFEHLMFEGTDNIPRGKIDKYVTAAGGALNASTSFDQTDFFFKVPINQLQLALWIESERMRSLVIDSTGIETQRKVVKEELKQRYEGRPYGTVFDNLFKVAFKGTQYEWTPIGNAEHINRASTQQFLDFHKKFYLPNNACLVVGGDLDVAQTKKWIEAYYGDIPSGPAPTRIPVVIPEQKEPKYLKVEEKVTPLPAYIATYVTVDSRHEDADALEMLGSLLSTGRSSRLYQRLVDKDQLALQVVAFPFALDKSGIFASLAIANQGVELPAIKKAITEEIEKIQKDGITEEEFQKLRNAKESQFITGLTSLDNKLRQLAYFHLFQGNARLVNEEYARFMKVTRNDIQRVAKKYLVPSRLNEIEYVLVKDNDENGK